MGDRRQGLAGNALTVRELGAIAGTEVGASDLIFLAFLLRRSSATLDLILVPQLPRPLSALADRNEARRPFPE